MRVKLTIAYDGTGYQGWQVQKNGITIQGEVEKALYRICSKSMRVHGSGRTDAGVHALGQVAHFDPPPRYHKVPWDRALNTLLPSSIRVLHWAKAEEEFHARFSARGKQYSYTLWTAGAYFYPQRRNFVWNTGPLDLEAMQNSISCLLGSHDFSSFMNKGTEIKDTVRTIQHLCFVPGFTPPETVVQIRASGFLKQMARNIVSALVQVGQKKISSRDLETVLKNRDRSLVPATAPARGLCLDHVKY